VIRTCDNGHPPARVLSGRPCRECERRRPSRQARGYDALHQTARRALLQQVVEAGGSLLCGYGCGTRVTTDTMVAAHVQDGAPDLGWIPACRSCNERAKRRGWGSPSDSAATALTRARQSEVRPGFCVFRAGDRDRATVGPRAPQGARVAR
jgi:hypothetical protein